MKTVLRVIVLLAVIFVMGACKQAVDTTVKKYTVEFNTNAENAVGTMEVQTFTKGVEQKLTKNTYSRTGYLFSGWVESKTATTVMYADEASFKATKNTTLYALWTETAKFEKPVSGATQAYTGSELTHNVTGFDASNMTIAGNIAGTNAGEYTVTVSLKESNVTWTDNTKEPVEVIWKISQATNSWEIEPSIADWNDEESASEEAGEARFGVVEFSYKQNNTVLQEKPTAVGSYFLVASVVETDNYASLTKEVSFKIIEAHTVNFDSNGGNSLGKIIVDHDKTENFPIPKLAGKTFEGWYKDESLGFLVNMFTSITESMTLYAKWGDANLSPEYYTLVEDSYSVSRVPQDLSGKIIISKMYNGLPVTSIENSAFKGCKDIESITIPDSVTYLGEYAFSGCTNLTNVKLPNSITNINQYAFQACTNLTDVTIPNSVKTIRTGAFAGCTSMQNIILEEGNIVFQVIDGALCTNAGTLLQFPAGKNVESFTTPDGITRIEHFAFQNNKFVTEIILKDEVTYIGNNAFDGCSSLKSITIPESVKTIGGRAFLKCDSLEVVNTLYTKGTVPEKWSQDNNEKLFNLLNE